MGRPPAVVIIARFDPTLALFINMDTNSLAAGT